MAHERTSHTLLKVTASPLILVAFLLYSPSSSAFARLSNKRLSQALSSGAVEEEEGKEQMKPHLRSKTRKRMHNNEGPASTRVWMHGDIRCSMSQLHEELRVSDFIHALLVNSVDPREKALPNCLFGILSVNLDILCVNLGISNPNFIVVEALATRAACLSCKSRESVHGHACVTLLVSEALDPSPQDSEFHMKRTTGKGVFTDQVARPLLQRPGSGPSVLLHP